MPENQIPVHHHSFVVILWSHAYAFFDHLSSPQYLDERAEAFLSSAVDILYEQTDDVCEMCCAFFVCPGAGGQQGRGKGRQPMVMNGTA